MKGLFPCDLNVQEGLICDQFIVEFDLPTVAFVVILVAQGAILGHAVPRYQILIATASAIASTQLAFVLFRQMYPVPYGSVPEASLVAIWFTPILGALGAWIAVKRHKL